MLWAVILVLYVNGQFVVTEDTTQFATQRQCEAHKAIELSKVMDVLVKHQARVVRVTCWGRPYKG